MFKKVYTEISHILKYHCYPRSNSDRSSPSTNSRNRKQNVEAHWGTDRESAPTSETEQAG